MRHRFVIGLTLCLLLSPAIAQQMATPSTVDAIQDGLVREGKIVVVDGYLEAKGSTSLLRDARTGSTLILDFSRSPSPASQMMRSDEKPSPVQVLGRYAKGAAGSPAVLVVLNVTRLTP